jgi:metal-responsive CopG/Arc/MetJ family transcriptional regulator
MAKSKAKQWGGPRPGAGRPKEGVVRVCITIPEGLAEEVTNYCQIGEIKRSHFFKTAVEHFLSTMITDEQRRAK